MLEVEIPMVSTVVVYSWLALSWAHPLNGEERQNFKDSGSPLLMTRDAPLSSPLPSMVPNNPDQSP
jgi:hypothetical protein